MNSIPTNFVCTFIIITHLVHHHRLTKTCLVATLALLEHSWVYLLLKK